MILNASNLIVSAMPIIVPCPKCGVSLSVPESAAGKRAQCPRFGCAAIVNVPVLIPAEEVIAEEEVPTVVDIPPAPKPRPKPASVDEDEEEPRPRKKSQTNDEEKDNDDSKSDVKRRRDDEADKRRRKLRRQDDDDYEFDHKRSRRRGHRGMGPGAILGIVFGVLVLLAGFMYAIYALVGRTSSFDESVKKELPPPGWREFTYKDYGFKVSFPKEPIIERVNSDRIASLGFGGVEAVARETIESGAIYSAGVKNDPVSVLVVVYRYKGGGVGRSRLESEVHKTSQQTASRRNGEIKTVNWLGVRAEEVATPEGVIRTAFTDSALFIAMIRAKGGTRATQTEENWFFDNLKLLR